MISFWLPSGPLHVIAVAAHPDDVEIGAGGLLASLAARPQVTGTWLTLTGSPQREAEAVGAAQAFLPGATSHFAHLPDGRLPACWEAAKEALHTLAQTSPPADLVLVPRADDAHQDHRLIADLAPTVWRDSLIVHYEIPKWDGDLGRPTAYLPLTAEQAHAKVDLLTNCYPSQKGRDWWSPETFLALMRLRGMECRAPYAEGFAVTKWIIETAPHGRPQ